MAAEKHYNEAGTHVLVYNPVTDGRWECPPDYLPVALARGWELAEPVEEDAAEVVEQSKSKPPTKPRKSITPPDPTPGD